MFVIVKLPDEVPRVAVIVVEPAETPVNKPVVSIVPIETSELFQVVEAIKLLFWSKDVNDVVEPTIIERFEGKMFVRIRLVGVD